MDPLAKLFGSPARVKLLRLFLFNADQAYSVNDAASRTRLGKAPVRKEIVNLVAAKVLRKKGNGTKTTFMADTRFTHYEALQGFLRATTGVSDADILGGLKKAGTLRFVTLTGLFTGAIEPKVDLLIVGDRLDDRVLGNMIHAIEAELGRELRYAAFSTEEYKYRTGVYDRLIRDVLDYPNRAILDRMSA